MNNSSNTITQFQDEFSEEVWKTTYKYHEDATIDDTLRRVAHSIASVEKTDELKKEWGDKFYDMLSNFKVTCGGRIYSNAGTEFRGTTLLNCYVGPKPNYDQDSLDGIIQTLLYQAKTLKSEGGWGMNFSFIRPRGSFIYGIGVETPGAVKYMELFDKTSDIITAGSGEKSKNKKAKGKIRKGAMMGVLWCWHPDIEEFIDAKLTEGRLSKFNISVGCSDEFMDKILALKEAIRRGDTEYVAKHDKWDLIFPDTTYAKYKEEWNGDIQSWGEKGYPIITRKIISALGLWDKIMKATYTRNDPGILFLDRANKTHCWNYGGEKSKIHATNPCQPAWAKVLTEYGQTDLGDIKVGDKIWSTEGWTTVLKKWSTGTKKVYRYALENGCCFYGTKNHRVVQRGAKVEVDDAEYIDSFAEGAETKNWSRTDRRTKKTKPIKIQYRQFVSEEEVFDITVDNVSHTYWTGGVNVSNCGEQALPFSGSCNLASLNLTQFIKDDYSGFDLPRIQKYVSYAVRFLDNVNDYTGTPLEQYSESARERRRIGLGIMGWGSALYLLKIPFASDEAEKIKERLMKTFTDAAINTSIDLAKEKGMFKDCDPQKHSQAVFWSQIGLSATMIEAIKKHGIRNSALFSIQPTGNTSILANIVSGGLEPIFLPEYIRTVIVPECPEELKSLCPKYWEGEFKETELFKLTKEGSDDVLKGTDNGIVYKIDRNRGLTKEVPCMDYAVRHLQKNNEWNPNAPWAKTALSLSVSEHVRDMTGWGKWIDSSMSKTVNVASDYPYDQFENLYLDAYRTGFLKGITTYRAGTMTSVLSQKTEEKKNDEKSEEILVKTRAPKRPKKLECSVAHITSKGYRFYAVVGLLNGEPYEVFAGSNHDSEGEIIVPKTVSSGEVVKVSRGNYRLVAKDHEYPISLGHSDANVDALTRMISTALRHGADISFVVHQLEKTKGDMQSFARVLSRALKKHIKNGATVHGESCPSCSSHNLVRQDGCITCKDCGWTKCA